MKMIEPPVLYLGSQGWKIIDLTGPSAEWPCMTEAELAGWRRANETLTGSAKRNVPCHDCDQSYASRMQAMGVCVGSPIKPRRILATS